VEQSGLLLEWAYIGQKEKHAKGMPVFRDVRSGIAQGHEDFVEGGVMPV